MAGVLVQAVPRPARGRYRGRHRDQSHLAGESCNYRLINNLFLSLTGDTVCLAGPAAALARVGGVPGSGPGPWPRDTRGLEAEAAVSETECPPLLRVERIVSVLWLEMRRRGSDPASDIEDIESRGSSSPLKHGK